MLSADSAQRVGQRVQLRYPRAGARQRRESMSQERVWNWALGSPRGTSRVISWRIDIQGFVNRIHRGGRIPNRPLRSR